MSQIHPVKYLRRTEASTYLREQWGLSYSPSTLAKLACGDDAPAHHRCGRVVLYAPADLDRWAAARIETPAPRMTRTGRALDPSALYAAGAT
jgi:hypothetical protein